MLLSKMANDIHTSAILRSYSQMYNYVDQTQVVMSGAQPADFTNLHNTIRETYLTGTGDSQTLDTNVVMDGDET